MNYQTHENAVLKTDKVHRHRTGHNHNHHRAGRAAVVLDRAVIALTNGVRRTRV